MKRAKRMLSLLLTGLMLLGMTACGEATSSVAVSSAATESTATEAAPAANSGSNTLRVGLDGEPQSLAATEAIGTNGAMFVGYCLYDSCWRVNTNGERTMLLADSYTVADDNSTIILGFLLQQLCTP